MQAAPWASFSSYAAITPSATTLLNCRAIYVGGSGNIVVAPYLNATQVTFAVLAGLILPVELNQGLVVSATATGLVALQ